MIHRHSQTGVSLLTRRATALALLLLTLFAGFFLPAHAGVQMQQAGVDVTPPPLPPAGSGVSPNGAQQPLTPQAAMPAVDPTVEYSTLIRNQSTQSSLDNGLFGESIDYYTGETDFVATDVSLPLNAALPMAVSRRYHVGNRAGGPLSSQFGDWELDIPHIETVLATSVGWTVSGSGPYNACSNFQAPNAATVTNGSTTTTIPASEYSQGYAMVIPGQGRHELLLRDSTNTIAPTGDYAAYPVVTHDWWVASCRMHLGTGLNARRQGDPQQDFIVTSPQGVTYTFSYYTTRPYPSYQRIDDSQTATSGAVAVLPRTQGFMLPDTIEDRFGNWIQYSYSQDGNFNYHLTKIVSNGSDPHTITLSLNLDYTIKQIEDNIAGNGRVWKYTYSNGALTTVTLPDSTTWKLDLSQLNTAAWTYTNPICTSLPTPTYPSGSSLTAGSPQVNATFTAPSGAAGTFTFGVTRQGRNSAPATCLTNQKGTAFAALQPAVFDVLALTKKAISGPKLPSTYTWNLAYAGCTTTSCSAMKTTTVTDARGFDTTYTFGAVYGTTAASDTEGQLQKVESGGKAKASYLRTDSYQYFTNCGTSCPTTVGQTTQVRGDAVPLNTLRPISSHTIVQDGATYTQTLSNPDAYGFAKTITRVGTDTKTDTMTYYHDTGLWVIGTPTELDSGGKAEWKVIPNSFDRPQELDRFGRTIATYQYYNDGTLKSVSDNAGNATTYSSYTAGKPQNISYANGNAESAVIRWDGRVTSHTDADGNKTGFGYDSGGRLNAVTYPTDSPAFTAKTITWTTPLTGWTRTETVGSYSRTTAYDAFLQAVTDNENATRYTAKTYDADGHVTFASYVEGSANPTQGITNTYDGIGRLTQSKDVTGQPIVYTPGKNNLKVTDRDGHATTTTFKQYDTPDLDWPVTIAAPIATTTIGRNTWGQVTSLTRGGIERDRGYNSYQQLQTITDPERTDSLTLDYDTAGNLWHVKRNGATAETRTYDTRSRLTGISYANADPSASFDWWPTGEPKSQSRGSNSHTYTYNTRHEVKTETITTNGGSYGLKYDYDALAHLTTFTYPDNASVAMAPDALGQPTTVGSYATSIRFYPHGAIKTFSYGNGIAHTMTLTSDNRLLPGEVYDVGAVDLVTTYDDNAFPLSITDKRPGAALSRGLSYDTGNRLKTANATNLWGNTTFSYDIQDTLTVDTTGSTTTIYTPDSTTNLPFKYQIGSTTTNLSWDGEGNLKQKGTGATAPVFTWNTANELTQLVQNSTTYRYSYDGKGDRATAVTDAGGGSAVPQTDSVYDLGGRLVYESVTTAPPADRIFTGTFETPAPAAQTTKYIYLGSHTIAKVVAGSTTTTTYLHTDALGSPIAQTDTSKNIVGTTAHLPYGGTFSSTGTGNVAGLGYAGASADPTGLIYMHARYLDPQLRRFISLDPVDVDAGTALNFNRYSYALNSPYSIYDPSGRDAILVDKSGATQPAGCEMCVIGPTGYWQLGNGAIDELGYGPGANSAQLNAPITLRDVGTGIGYLGLGAGAVSLALLAGPETAAGAAAIGFFDQVGFSATAASALLNPSAESITSAGIDGALLYTATTEVFPGMPQFLQLMHFAYEVGNFGEPQSDNQGASPDNSQDSTNSDQQSTNSDLQP